MALLVANILFISQLVKRNDKNLQTEVAANKPVQLPRNVSSPRTELDTTQQPKSTSSGGRQNFCKAPKFKTEPAVIFVPPELLQTVDLSDAIYCGPNIYVRSNFSRNEAERESTLLTGSEVPGSQTEENNQTIQEPNERKFVVAKPYEGYSKNIAQPNAGNTQATAKPNEGYSQNIREPVRRNSRNVPELYEENCKDTGGQNEINSQSIAGVIKESTRNIKELNGGTSHATGGPIEMTPQAIAVTIDETAQDIEVLNEGNCQSMGKPKGNSQNITGPSKGNSLSLMKPIDGNAPVTAGQARRPTTNKEDSNDSLVTSKSRGNPTQSNLTEKENKHAIVTVLMICVSFIVLNLLSSACFIVIDCIDESAMHKEARDLLRTLASTVQLINHSINFFYCLRSPSFRAALQALFQRYSLMLHNKLFRT